METVVDKAIAHKTARLLLSIGAVTINTKKPFRYVSGLYAPMYTDVRLIMSYPKVWKEITDGYISVMKKVVGFNHIDVLSGTATAAIPYTAAIAARLGIPMIYVRASKKDHGKENQIEGKLSHGNNVLVIEDLLSTGSSVSLNTLAVRSAGAIVKHCIAVTTTTHDGFDTTVRDLGITVSTLTDITHTINTAVRLRYITHKQKETVESFVRDPVHWGKVMGFE